MSAAAGTHEQKVLTSLLLAALIIAAVAMVREGPHFDNVIDGWRFFTMAFFAGALAGFLLWTHFFRPGSFSLTGPGRNPWLAALALGLVTASTVSYVNRAFAAPPHRAITAEVDSVAEGRGDRWHVTVKLPDGQYHRYLIPADSAAALKGAKAVRLGIARGALGYDYVVRFDPAGG